MQDRRLGILLANLGSPDAPDAPAVRRYLRQLLDDPRVLGMARLPRWALVNLVIAPTRASASAHAYRAVWTDEGSPLLVHARAVRDGLVARGWRAELGMQCGRPSIAEGVDALADVDTLVVFPLYPQYASATTGGVVEGAFRALAPRAYVPELRVVGPFFDDPRYLDAAAAVARPALAGFEPDHVLFSFHGLPETQVPCVDDACAAGTGGERARHCYRAQCYATARGLVDRLAPASHSVAFQSRLGRAKWLEPATDATVTALARRGVRRLAVLCPSFVADCLETLEEIGIRARDSFREAGGEELLLVPSLNGSEDWIAAVDAMAREAAG